MSIQLISQNISNDNLQLVVFGGRAEPPGEHLAFESSAVYVYMQRCIRSSTLHCTSVHTFHLGGV